MKYRTEEFSHEYQSTTVSADWYNTVDAMRSFTQLLLGHGLTPAQAGKACVKARDDFAAGATVCQIFIESGYTVSLYRVSNLGHAEKGTK